MTRYIRKGSPSRTDAASKWGVSDLRRRPPVATDAAGGGGGGLSAVRCRASAVGAGNLTVFSASNTLITLFNTFENDDPGIFSTSSSAITVHRTGLYLLKGSIQWSVYPGTLPGSIRNAWIFIGSSIAAWVDGDSPSPLDDFTLAQGYAWLEAGKNITLVAHQDSATTMTVYGGGDGSITNPDQDGCYLEATYCGATTLDWVSVNCGDGMGTITNDTVTDIVWDNYSIAPGSNAFEINTATNPIKAKLDGWYDARIVAQFADSVGSADTYAGAWVVPHLGSDPGVEYDGVHGGGPHILPAATSSLTWMNRMIYSPTGPFYMRGQRSGPYQIKGKVYQKNSIPRNRDWEGAEMIVVYLGAGLGLGGATTMSAIEEVF